MYATSLNFGTIKHFRLPDLGEKIKDATVKKWYVKEGDHVNELDILADVATDKLFTQIPSSYDGVIHKRYYKEEEACAVGEILVDIKVDSKAVSDKSETHQQAPKATQEAAEHTSSLREYAKSHATPAIRGLLFEHKLNINDIKGTGRHGRVTKQDIMEHLKKLQDKEPQQKPLEKAHETQKTHESHAHQQIHKVSGAPRHITAKGAAISKRAVQMNKSQSELQKHANHALEIPHFNFKDDIDMTELHELRTRLKIKGLTYLPFFIKSFSLALLGYPIMNSTYEKGKQFEYTIWDNHNISIPIDTPHGLALPNIKNCQAKTILQIHNELQRLRHEAVAGQLSEKDLAEGTICMSNLGIIGGTYFAPMILPPQVAIVTLGRFQVLPKQMENEKGELEVKPRRIANISFAADHRVLDGATVAKFSNRWRGYLENPAAMLLSLR